MPHRITYDPNAAHRLLDQSLLSDLEPSLLAARDEAFADVALYRSGGVIPQDKQPLDAAFIDLPRKLLDGYAADKTGSELGRILATAEMLRDEVDRVVSLGIGGSYMGARALFEALCHPHHNALPKANRGGTPQIFFEGNNLDNDALHALLEMLQVDNRDAEGVLKRWAIIVISKSGGTLETAAAFRLFRAAIEDYYGEDANTVQRYIVPVTGESGKLRELSGVRGYESVFDVPEGVGGRFSVLSAVGLLPAAVMGLDIVQLLEGADAMNDTTRSQPTGENPVLDYTATCHLFEKHHGMTTRILSTWGSRLEAFGFWYDQLLSESLGKEEQGATPITGVNTRDLHSRGQQHQEGRRDKLITNLIVNSASREHLALPSSDDNQDDLNRFAGKTVPEFLNAAIEGTNQAYTEADRPTADIRVEKLDEYAMGQLFQMLMLATVIEGRLIGINPYGQPGVEAYKKNMNAILERGTS